MAASGTSISRRGFGLLGAGLGAGLLLDRSFAAWAREPLLGRVILQPFANSPFPYEGTVPDTGSEFLDVRAAGRRGHTSSRGGVYWEDPTYNDNRVLLALPPGFDIKTKPLIIVYFHGNGAILDRDVVRRQAVVDQVVASGLNAALVAPQFAVDALDSSAGRFWLPGAFAAFMSEAADRLGKLEGGAIARKVFATAPIVLVAYSGGYEPAAYVLAAGGEPGRIKGVILLDAVFGAEDLLANWITREHRSAFFFSAFSNSAEPGNIELEDLLRSRHIAFSEGVPKRLAPGTTGFYGTSDAVGHSDFVTDAWEDWPLRSLLARIAI